MLNQHLASLQQECFITRTILDNRRGKFTFDFPTFSPLIDPNNPISHSIHVSCHFHASRIPAMLDVNPLGIRHGRVKLRVSYN